MSASLINFESAQEKEQQRQFERKARQAILEKAQQEYETREQQQEAARQRGEHTWMLPSVEAKLAQDHDATRKKKKKKKDKKKKKKKEKKAKKSKRKDSSSSSSDSEEDEDDEGEAVWVESSSSAAAPKPPPGQQPTPQAPAPQPPPQESSTGESVKRDGWMEMTSLFGTFSREEMREREGTSRKKAKEEEERKKREAAKPGSHARELNPYYKDGGSGLPEEQPKPSSTAPLATAPQTTGVDAGWLHRALQRAKEQARAEGKTLEEVASERWGSLARFNELLAEAEGRGKQRENDARNQSRRRERRSRSRSREKDKMRNRSRSRERDRRRSRSRDRNRDRRSRSKSQERGRGRGKRRSRSRDRGRNRSRSKSQERERSRKNKRERSKSTERRRRHERHSSSSSSSSSSTSRDSSRSSSRNRSKPGDRREDRHSREDGSAKFSQKLLKPSEDLPKSSGLSLRFQKPGEDSNAARSASWSTHRGPSSSSSSSSNRWQKKEHRQPAKEQQPDRRPRSSSSSSSSSSNSDDEDTTTSTSTSATARGGERGEAPTTITTATAKHPPPTTAPPAAPLTDKEMNDLAAKIMKAELVGNEAQAAKLKSRLEAARAMRAAGSGAAMGGKVEASGPTEQVVVLTRTDSRGISRPVVGAAEAEAGQGKKKTKVKTHGKDGQRARYFPDDDQHSLKNMFEKEKGTTADDQNAMFEKAAMMNPERLNDDYDIDDMFMSKAALRDSAAKQAERDKKKAIQEHQRAERSLESCQWCFDNKEMPKHLIVALGTKCYVSLPAHQSLTPGHCCIAPIHHISCCVQAEEDLWDEIQNFRKSLVKMFASRGEDCIFFETAKRLRHFPHMVLQCVPLPRETGDMAPIYFKKAIMECEHEWAQNKKLVDLKGRDVRRAVPKGLPYFFVDFAMDAGFAHVIEDEQEFPNYFAQEIVGGMLDLENNLWRKPRRENFETQRRKVMEFSRWYKEFDPTQEG